MVDQPIPVHDLAKSLEEGAKFSLQKLEKSYPSYNASRAHRHTYFELLFFEDGGGYHEIDFERFPIHAQSVHLVSPQQIHVLHREPQVRGYVISFTEEVFLSVGLSLDYIKSLLFFQPINSHPVISLDASTANRLRDVILELQEETNQRVLHYQESIALQLSNMLLVLKRNLDTSAHCNRYNSITIEFIRLVQKHYREINHVQSYAEMLHVSAGHLNELVKTNTNKTAKTFIQDYLLLEAKRLLMHSDLSIKQIAIHLNFADSSYFTRFFKQQVGASPASFRDGIREK